MCYWRGPVHKAQARFKMAHNVRGEPMKTVLPCCDSGSGWTWTLCLLFSWNHFHENLHHVGDLVWNRGNVQLQTLAVTWQAQFSAPTTAPRSTRAGSVRPELELAGIWEFVHSDRQTGRDIGPRWGRLSHRVKSPIGHSGHSTGHSLILNYK
jgi:hypothetical protein